MCINSFLDGKMVTTKINNRRYLGNKYRLLPFISDVIAKECGNFDTFADIFAGTGAVSSAYTDKILYTNDILYSNYLCHLTWFSDEGFDIGNRELYRILQLRIALRRQLYDRQLFRYLFFKEKLL